MFWKTKNKKMKASGNADNAQWVVNHSLRSDVGMVRQINEDAARFTKPKMQRHLQKKVSWRCSLMVWVVMLLAK